MKNLLSKVSLLKSTVVATALSMMGFVLSPALAIAAPIDSGIPSTSITSPLNGSTVSGSISVNATASDTFSSCVVTLSGSQFDVSTLQNTHSGGNLFVCGTDMTAIYQSQHGTNLSRMQPYLIPSGYSGVIKVEFYVDGTLSSTDTSSPYSFAFDSMPLSNGPHILMVKAFDAALNIGTSSISVTVSNGSPSDTTAPTVSITSPTAMASVSGSTTVTASASDNIGVSKVELYVEDVLVSTDTSSPYSFVWNSASVANGVRSLIAKAYDAAGNIGVSPLILVNISNASPDTAVPTVSITSPLSGSSVSGSVNVLANAADNVGVSKVELYVDGTLSSTDTSSPYSFALNSTSLSNGSHVLMAKAYDAAGNVGSSSSVSITVSNIVTPPDTTAPTVSITSPLSGSNISEFFTITAGASDNTGVTKVEFYIDGSLASTDSVSPFSFLWNSTGASNGSHSLMAKAYDAAGNVGSSSPITVMVNNQVVVPGGGDDDENESDDEFEDVNEHENDSEDMDEDKNENEHEEDNDDDKGQTHQYSQSGQSQQWYESERKNKKQNHDED